MANVFVNLNKTASIKQHFNAFASGVLTLGVLFLFGIVSRADHSLVVTSLEVGKFASGGGKVRGVRHKFSLGACLLYPASRQYYLNNTYKQTPNSS